MLKTLFSSFSWTFEADPLEARWRSLNDHLSTRGKACFMAVMLVAVSTDALLLKLP